MRQHGLVDRMSILVRVEYYGGVRRRTWRHSYPGARTLLADIAPLHPACCWLTACNIHCYYSPRSSSGSRTQFDTPVCIMIHHVLHACPRRADSTHSRKRSCRGTKILILNVHITLDMFPIPGSSRLVPQLRGPLPPGCPGLLACPWDGNRGVDTLAMNDQLQAHSPSNIEVPMRLHCNATNNKPRDPTVCPLTS